MFPSLLRRRTASGLTKAYFWPARFGFARLLRSHSTYDLDNLCKRIRVPNLPVADEDMSRMRYWEEGRAMARQEAWETLSERIRTADIRRSTTPGGLAEATLLAMGAHADVVGAVTDALHDGQEPASDGMADLDRIAEEHAGDHPLKLVVALAHIRCARAWSETQITHSHEREERARNHLKSAQDLVAHLDAEVLDAPSLSAAQADLTFMVSKNTQRTKAAYRAVISLDPENPQHLRAYGVALCALSGNIAQEASEIADLLAPVSGSGAYVWIFLDALSRERTLLSSIDADQFIQGLRDIFSDGPDQHIVNELAAFCALEMRPDQKLDRAAENVRRKLHTCLDWILREFLQELHPAQWVGDRRTEIELRSQIGQRALLAEGRKIALQCIARHFAADLADGSSIAFSPAGMYKLPAI